jgi:dolichol-phosphate mannosyltransferase
VWRRFEPDRWLPVHETALSFYSVAALLLGAQFMSIGFLAEMITAYAGRDHDSYSVAETTE